MKKYRNFLILITFTMGTQAILYYALKLVINDYHIINSIIDIPLVKPFIYIYNSWYPFIILSSFIIYKNNQKTFKYLIATMLLGAIFAQITFIVYPSMIIRPIIKGNTLTDLFLSFTYQNDNPPINCLPSMHCIYCFIVSYYTIKCQNINITKKVLIVSYSIIIILSTLLVKQHVIEDAILALIYTILATFIIYKNKNKIINLFNKINL